MAKINAPIVWSLHDMWAFTDGYHYDETYNICKNYCDYEPKNFLSNKVFARKKKTYKIIGNMTIIGLSRWMRDCAKNSVLLKDKQHINLPNPIDTSIFKPFNKNESRKLWNLPQDKKLVLFGAMGATNDPRKGFSELSEALRRMTISGVEFVVFGNDESKILPNLGFEAHYLGKMYDDMHLARLYSAVDVMIVPSLQENLSNAIMESLACATPVVGFDIGGNSDMIEHQQNGYLVKPFNTIDLKNGIEWVLNHASISDLKNNARCKVLTEFDSKVVAKKYVELYKNILQI